MKVICDKKCEEQESLILALKRNIEEKEEFIERLMRGHFTQLLNVVEAKTREKEGSDKKEFLKQEKSRMQDAVRMISSSTGLTILLVACAWCNTPLTVKDGLGVAGVSHSICNGCRKVLEDGYAR